MPAGYDLPGYQTDPPNYDSQVYSDRQMSYNSQRDYSGWGNGSERPDVPYGNQTRGPADDPYNVQAYDPRNTSFNSQDRELNFRDYSQDLGKL